MGRRKRFYLPRAVFHITARTHCREPYFHDGLRDEIVDIMTQEFERCDAQLIAFNIMPNHYHIVIQQRNASLAQLMQPINRRIALRVQRDQRRKGHVFGQPYFAKPCADAAQMREMIVYTHRNAIRAKLCRGLEDWRWCSHWAYIREGKCAAAVPPPVYGVLPLFADDESGNDAEEGYLAFIRWRDECDKLPDDAVKPPPPLARSGDRFYSRHFIAAQPLDFKPERDLCDIIRETLKEIAPELTLDDLKTPLRNKRIVSVRHTIIANATRAHHRTCDIARTLNLSDSAVSRVAVTIKFRLGVRFDNRSGHFPF